MRRPILFLEIIMECLPNGLTLEIPEGVFPLGTDSMALADLVRLPGSPRIMD